MNNLFVEMSGYVNNVESRGAQYRSILKCHEESLKKWKN